MANQEYLVLTLDTNIFFKNGYKFNDGYLDVLNNLKDSRVKLVLSEIVARELLGHLNEKVEEAVKALERVIKNQQFLGYVGSSSTCKLEEFIPSKGHKEIAKTLLDRYISNTGAEIVSCKNASIEVVVEKYFEVEPPFKGKKKSEFPDAIALLSLEAWAKKEGKRVLAVSADEDWVEFAEGSQWIDRVDTIHHALIKLPLLYQGINNEMEELAILNPIKRQLTSLGGNDCDSNLYEQFIKELHEYLEQRPRNVDGYSVGRVEGEVVGYEVLEARVISEHESGNGVICVGKNVDGYKFTLELNVDYEAYANFDMYIYDQIDQEEVHLCGQELMAEMSERMSVLATIGYDPDSDDQFQLVDLSVSEDSWKENDIIDFGEIDFYDSMP